MRWNEDNEEGVVSATRKCDGCRRMIGGEVRESSFKKDLVWPRMMTTSVDGDVVKGYVLKTRERLGVEKSTAVPLVWVSYREDDDYCDDCVELAICEAAVEITNRPKGHEGGSE